MNRIREIHEKALAAAKRYRLAEIDLIEILQDVGEHRVFYHMNYNSLFQYAVQALGLSEEVAYIFINVSRKSAEVPQLREEIRAGRISVTKAKRIAPILNVENQNHWLELARNSTKRQIEREVAIAAPAHAVREQSAYRSEQPEDAAKILKFAKVFVELKLGLPEHVMIRLRQVQDLVSQSLRTHATLAQTLELMVDLYLEKKDPLERAKRQKMRGKLPADLCTENVDANIKKLGPGTVLEEAASSRVSAATSVRSSKRESVSAELKNRIYLRDEGRCTFTDPNGIRCCQRRHLEIHHITPVSKGGKNEIENLALLCRGHHRSLHIVNSESNSI